MNVQYVDLEHLIAIKGIVCFIGLKFVVTKRGERRWKIEKDFCVKSDWITPLWLWVVLVRT